MSIDPDFKQYFKDHSKTVISNVRSQLAMNKFPRIKMNLYTIYGTDFKPEEIPKFEEPSSSGLVPNTEFDSLAPIPMEKKKPCMMVGLRDKGRKLVVKKKKFHKVIGNAFPMPIRLKSENVPLSNGSTITDEELDEIDVDTIPMPIKEDREVEIFDVEDVKPTFAIEVLKNIISCLEYFPMCCGTDKEIFQRFKYNFEDISFEVVSEVIRLYGSSCLLKIEINNDLTLWSSFCKTDGLNEGRIMGGYIQCLKNAIRLLKTPSSCGTSKEIFNRFVKMFDSLGCLDFATIDNLLKSYAGSHFQALVIGNVTVYSL